MAKSVLSGGRARCSVCGVIFTTAWAFDRHRVLSPAGRNHRARGTGRAIPGEMTDTAKAECRSPESMGLVEKDGAWGRPSSARSPFVLSPGWGQNSRPAENPEWLTSGDIGVTGAMGRPTVAADAQGDERAEGVPE